MAGVRSFDPAVPRPAPSIWVVRNSRGEQQQLTIDDTTLLVAVKANCDGCRSFYRENHNWVPGVRVLVAASTIDGVDEFLGGSREVVEAAELLTALGINWPPFYVLVGDSPLRVITEGVAFAPAQVAEEIAQFLA